MQLKLSKRSHEKNCQTQSVPMRRNAGRIVRLRNVSSGWEDRWSSPNRTLRISGLWSPNVGETRKFGRHRLKLWDMIWSIHILAANRQGSNFVLVFRCSQSTPPSTSVNLHKAASSTLQRWKQPERVQITRVRFPWAQKALLGPFAHMHGVNRQGIQSTTQILWFSLTFPHDVWGCCSCAKQWLKTRWTGCHLAQACLLNWRFTHPWASG